MPFTPRIAEPPLATMPGRSKPAIVLDPALDHLRSLIAFLRLAVENPDGSAGGLIALDARDHPKERDAYGATYRQYRQELRAALAEYGRVARHAYDDPYPLNQWRCVVEAEAAARAAR